MDLFEQTKNICDKYNIKPARSRGQNFLIKEEIYDKIIDTAELKPDDVVLEVGPGLGFLTAKLADKAKKVVAVEIDKKLAEVLKTGLAAEGIKNVEVVDGDILKTPLTPLIRGAYKIVANLPYNITSIFLRQFLSFENKPELMVLLLQKEVAQRITAKPGKMSLLAVSVQFYAKPELVEIVPKKYFWPEPEVDSAVVKIAVNPPNPLYQGGKTEKEFFRLVKFGFSARRKMLKNNLAAGLRIGQAEATDKIKQAGFNEKIRAQELAVADWLKLFNLFK